ncbi:MAG TPA: hypothetical protein PL029_04870 [Bacteroidia bacterium]|nr:hypothetical protein [Bacteroidia bacterium]
MKFDYTYIILSGRQIFEPMVIVTNFILLLISIYCFSQLVKFRSAYPSQMAWFIIIMGVSGCFGAAAHAMHYQYGKTIFNVIFFISNTLNLMAIYFCFKGSYTYSSLTGKPLNKKFSAFVLAWVGVLVIITLINNTFLLIKIHAGIALVYSLIVHYMGYKKNNDRGSRVVVTGIGISFLSIVVHSLHISLHEWFNYKDIAHVIMIVALIIIYRGIRMNAEQSGTAPPLNPF